MSKIKFSHHYSKLNAALFPTIRRWMPRKDEYYIPGKMFDVEVCGKVLGKAELLHEERVKTADLHPDFIDYDTDNGMYKLGKMDAMLLWFAWRERVEVEAK
jgi:hypothetical protein